MGEFIRSGHPLNDLDINRNRFLQVVHDSSLGELFESMQLSILEVLYLEFGYDFRLKLDHLVVIQQVVLKLHLVILLQLAFNQLELAQFYDEMYSFLYLFMGVDESILIVLSFLIYTDILGAAAVCLIETGFDLTDLLAVTDDGYISII